MNRIEQLSLAAIRTAASGLPADAATVAHWLYRFGAVPRGAAIDRDFGPDDDPMAVLGLTAGGRARRTLEAAFEPSSLSGWYSFARLSVPIQLTAACKLYVSPRPEALPDAFPRIADVIARADVRSFKIGRGIEGLLRPDKIIVYFDDRSHLEQVAGELARSLHGCPAQGVPFTTQTGATALLSAGIDPPLTAGATSWRGWVTKRLAASLVASAAVPDDDPVARALFEIRRAGVDEHWNPDTDAFCEVAS